MYTSWKHSLTTPKTHSLHWKDTSWVSHTLKECFNFLRLMGMAIAFIGGTGFKTEDVTYGKPYLHVPRKFHLSEIYFTCLELN